MLTKIKNLSAKTHITIFFVFTIAYLLCLSLICMPNSSIIDGIKSIITSRDVLFSDYFAIAGYSAAFLNSAVVMIMAVAIIFLLKVNFSGLTIACVLIMGGFAMFGKNPLNTFPIIAGSMLYAKAQGVNINRYIHVGFLASGVAPIISEIVFIFPFSTLTNVIIAIFIGLCIGYITPPLSAHTVTMHQGYNIFNVGFAIGIIAMIIYAFLSANGYNITTEFVWQEGIPIWLAVSMYIYFAIVALYGLIVSNFNFKGYLKLLEHPGKTVADFLLMDGAGLTLFNMAAVGVLCTTYIILIGGDLSGPVAGAIMTMVGFAAFGIHPRNFSPVMFGVFLSGVLHINSPTTPSLQVAAIFSGALAPLAGQFGICVGIIAGIIHSVVVSCTSSIYNGLNLYNNGFSAGFVAILMLPLIESFIKKYKKI